MKTLIVYDSQFGNTQAVAEAIGRGLDGEVALRRVGQLTPANLAGLDRLVVGSPTQGGHPTPAIKAWFGGLPADALRGVGVAAFDTRFARHEHGVGLGMVMAVLGFAAGRIAHLLESKGGRLLVPAEGFIVLDKEGPLAPGELDRAEHWLALKPAVTADEQQKYIAKR